MDSLNLPDSHIQAFLSCLQEQVPNELGMSDANELGRSDDNLFFEEALSCASSPTIPTLESGSGSDSGDSNQTQAHPNLQSQERRSAENSIMFGRKEDYPADVDPVLVENRRLCLLQRQSDRSERTESRKRALESMEGLPLEELLEEADLKRKRLARKAELARLSRKRKKTRVSELEHEVQQLKAELKRERVKVAELENERLQQLVNSPNNETNVDLDHRLEAKFQAICNAQIADQPDSIGAIGASIKDFLDAHANKNSCNELQLAGFENSLGSGVALSFVRWIMNQNDKFYLDPSGLWYSLFTQDLKCSPEQLQQLMELREKMKAKLQEWDEVEAAFKKLSPLLRSYYGESADCLSGFTQALSPSQTQNFFQWVGKFGEVCVKIKI